MKAERKRLKSLVLKLVLYLIFFGSLIGAGIYYWIYYGNQQESNEVFAQLEQSVLIQVEQLHDAADRLITRYEESTQDLHKEENTESYLDFQQLKNVNADIYAWIDIPDTPIQYPILQSETDDYYLMRNLDGSYGYPGCIFSNQENGLLDSEGFGILYGHNMKNETMFGSLYRYLEEDYFEEHPYVYVYTEDGISVYHILAATKWNNKNLESEYSNDTDGKRKFLNAIYEEGTGIFRESSAENGMDESLDKREVNASQLLVLSTCVRGDSNSRMLIVCQRI